METESLHDFSGYVTTTMGTASKVFDRFRERYARALVEERE